MSRWATRVPGHIEMGQQANLDENDRSLRPRAFAISHISRPSTALQAESETDSFLRSLLERSRLDTFRAQPYRRPSRNGLTIAHNTRKGNQPLRGGESRVNVLLRELSLFATPTCVQLLRLVLYQPIHLQGPRCLRKSVSGHPRCLTPASVPAANPDEKRWPGATHL